MRREEGEEGGRSKGIERGSEVVNTRAVSENMGR